MSTEAINNLVDLAQAAVIAWAFILVNERWQNAYRERTRRIEAATVALGEINAR